jgi:hypothetical protein
VSQIPPPRRYPRKPLSLPLQQRRFPVGMIVGTAMAVLLTMCFVCACGGAMLFRVLH